ncbi:hypothetical protein EHF33_15875 [Deinococcus psychrotolerans]|uniref:Uncharacterized protein n=1 Tax=Deinococcus psychrotolerans TaxID=2489213 RepID=A0A3G8YG88_9DEIO|nr:hypothetical protein [Deinococcus psychrotolerans]AZI44359.1 hypothetical protein EHF33_15875 [Deinococcus psychrotolerans]
MRQFFRLIDIHLRFFVAVVLLACGSAFAQDVQLGSGLDFRAWGSSAAVFAALGVAPAVTLIKARFPALSGWWVLAVSLALSEVGSYVLYAANLLTDQTYAAYQPPFIWILFGFSAFLIASGGYAVLAQLLSKTNSRTVTATATAAQPATDTSPALPPTAEVVINPAPKEQP